MAKHKAKSYPAPEVGDIILYRIIGPIGPDFPPEIDQEFPALVLEVKDDKFTIRVFSTFKGYQTPCVVDRDDLWRPLGSPERTKEGPVQPEEKPKKLIPVGKAISGSTEPKGEPAVVTEVDKQNKSVTFDTGIGIETKPKDKDPLANI